MKYCIRVKWSDSSSQCKIIGRYSSLISKDFSSSACGPRIYIKYKDLREIISIND